VLGASGVSARRDYSSGVLARLAAVLTDGVPISFTSGLPLAFKGRTGVPNIELKGLGKSIVDERQASLLSEMYAGNPLGSTIADGLRLRQEVVHSMEKEMLEANRDAIDPTDLQVEAGRSSSYCRSSAGLSVRTVTGAPTTGMARSTGSWAAASAADALRASNNALHTTRSFRIATSRF
jgi:hypothetical protein